MTQKRVDYKLFKTLGDSVTDPEFCPWEYLAGQNPGGEMAYLYLTAFWPEFIKVDDYILLSSHYYEESYKELVQAYPQYNLESVINLTYLVDIFGYGVPEESDDAWEAVGNLMARLWKTKAELDFPDLEFASEFWWDGDEDPMVTIYQKRYG